MNLYQYHPRHFGQFRYVYPVISRRSGGLSLGVNLSPTGLCNFSCAYCQVLSEQESRTGGEPDVIANDIVNELAELVEMYRTGTLYRNTYLATTPPEKQILKDIAFSGDGEPTLLPQFGEVVRQVTEYFVRTPFLEQPKIVCITNATTLHIESVRQALDLMLRCNGVVWAKLDAGTPEYYRKVNRSSVPFEKIIDNLQHFPQKLVVQSCFLLLDGQPPPESEVAAYCKILQNMHNIEGVQLYTVARNVPEPWVKPLPAEILEAIAVKVREETRLEVKIYE